MYLAQVSTAYGEGGVDKMKRLPARDEGIKSTNMNFDASEKFPIDPCNSSVILI